MHDPCYSSSASSSDSSTVTSPSQTSSWYSLQDGSSPDTSDMMSLEFHPSTPRSHFEHPRPYATLEGTPFEGINTDILPHNVYVDEVAFYQNRLLLSQMEETDEIAETNGEEVVRPSAKSLEQREENSRKRQQQIAEYRKTVVREERTRRRQFRELARISKRPYVTVKKQQVHGKKVRFDDN